MACQPRRRGVHLDRRASGGAQWGTGTARILPATLILIVVYRVTAALFAAFGQYMGRLFRSHPPLRAYSIEVAGSLAGIGLFALMSRLQTPPPGWFAVRLRSCCSCLLPWWPPGALVTLGAAVVVLATLRESQAHVVALLPHLAHPAGARHRPRDETWVATSEPIGKMLTVNNDYHQMMLDLRSRPQQPAFVEDWRQLYEAPYARYAEIAPLPPGRILVVGAGTGNDVAAALRRRAGHRRRDRPDHGRIGVEQHPERPYYDPRVRLVVDDARKLFHRARSGEYDADRARLPRQPPLLSALELGPARQLHLHAGSDGGGIPSAGARRAGGPHLPRSRPARGSTRACSSSWGRGSAGAPGRSTLVPATRMASCTSPSAARRPRRTATTRWDLSSPAEARPFLYLRERGIPPHNVLFLLVALSLSACAFLVLPKGERRIRVPYFLLGAAFFLLETSNVVRMALLFGSTWAVNTVVFAGILALVLLANLTASRWRVPISGCVAAVGVGYPARGVAARGAAARAPPSGCGRPPPSSSISARCSSGV